MLNTVKKYILAGCILSLMGLFLNLQGAEAAEKNVIQGDGQVMSIELSGKAEFNRKSIPVSPDMQDSIVSETIYSSQIDNVRIMVNNGIYTDTLMKDVPEAKRQEFIQKAMINQITTINTSKEYQNFNITYNEPRNVNGIEGREAIMTYDYQGVKIKTKVLYVLYKNELWAICFDMLDDDKVSDEMTDHAYESLTLKEYV